MGIFSSDKKVKTTTVNNVTNTSTGLEGIEGTAILGSGNSLVQTDHGAITAGEKIAREGVLAGAEIARDSLTALRDATEAGLSFGSDALDIADRAGSRILDMAGRALDYGDDASARALSLVDEFGARQSATMSDALRFADQAGARERDAFSDALSFSASRVQESTEFARSLFGESLEAVTGVLKEGQAQLGNTVSNLNAIARQQSTSTDERVQAVAEKAIKYVLIAVGLVVGSMMLRAA